MEILRINDKVITLEKLLHKVKTVGWGNLIKPLLVQAIVEEYAENNQLVVSDEELQEEFDRFRRWKGLFTATETERWLKESGVTLEDLEKELEVNLLTDEIKETIPRDAVERYFAENKVKMDAVELSKLTVKEQEVAVELLAQLKEDEAEFMLLARDYSIDERAKCGGYMGNIQRGELSNELAPQIFGATVGDVLGPIPIDQGFELIQVNGFKPAALDERIEREIRNALFESFLIEQEKQLKIDWRGFS